MSPDGIRKGVGIGEGGYVTKKNQRNRKKELRKRTRRGGGAHLNGWGVWGKKMAQETGEKGQEKKKKGVEEGRTPGGIRKRERGLRGEKGGKVHSPGRRSNLKRPERGKSGPDKKDPTIREVFLGRSSKGNSDGEGREGAQTKPHTLGEEGGRVPANWGARARI